jgi:secreted trypsin-like serine protease
MVSQIRSGRKSRNVVFLSSLFFAACGQDDQGLQRQKSESRVLIVGGKSVSPTVSDARRLSTVALTTDYKSAGRSGGSPLFDLGRSFCTATVISKRALLTAAHCIQEFDPRSRTKSSSFILPDTRHFIASFGLKVGKEGQWMRAEKVIPHPQWDPLQTLSGNPLRAPHDIGVVLLESDIPTEYQPVPVADTDFPLVENQTVTLVGYGVTLSRRNNNTGILREVQTSLQGVDKKNQLLNVGSWMKGACAGDSGGPMYAQDENGKWHVVGVTSAGVEIFQTCIGLDNSYTDARSHKAWLRQVLNDHKDDLL